MSAASQAISSPESHGGAPGTTRPYPSLCQINTRVFLTTLSRELGRAATLDDIPASELDRIAEKGYHGSELLAE